MCVLSDEKFYVDSQCNLFISANKNVIIPRNWRFINACKSHVLMNVPPFETEKLLLGGLTYEKAVFSN